jgi:hypothetical protein
VKGLPRLPRLPSLSRLPPAPSQHASVDAARAYVNANLERGVACPCCGQWAKTYKRKLNANMARGLMWLVSQWVPGEWVNVTETAPKWLLRSRELPKLVYWQLVEERPRLGVSSVGAGFWRPTTKGVDYVHRRVRVPAHVLVYDNAVVGYADTELDIVEALGDHDYAALMR